MRSRLFVISATVIVAVIAASCTPRERGAPTSIAEDDPGAAQVVEDSGDTAVGGSGDTPDAPGASVGRELAAVYDADVTGNFELYRWPDGEQLTNDPTLDSWGTRVSPDGTRMVFYRTPAGVHDQDYLQTTLWIADIDGSNETMIIQNGAYGWAVHGHAEFSPDGEKLVMFAGGLVTHIVITDVDGTNPQTVTQGDGVRLDPSWSPDASTIAYVACPTSRCGITDYEIYEIPAAGGERVRLTDDNLRDHDPFYSPDGSRIAILTQTQQPEPGAPVGYWDTRLITDGVVSQVTDGKAVRSGPRWSDSQTIWTHQLVYGSGTSFDVIAINVDTGDIELMVETRATEEQPSPYWVN